MVEVLMKKFLFSLCLSAFFLGGQENVFPLENWNVFYAGRSAAFKNKILTGTPQNSGTALVCNVRKGEFPSDITRLRVAGSGFEAKDLSLSLRGKQRITVQKAVQQKDGSFLLSLGVAEI